MASAYFTFFQTDLLPQCVAFLENWPITSENWFAGFAATSSTRNALSKKLMYVGDPPGGTPVSQSSSNSNSAGKNSSSAGKNSSNSAGKNSSNSAGKNSSSAGKNSSNSAGKNSSSAGKNSSSKRKLSGNSSSSNPQSQRQKQKEVQRWQLQKQKQKYDQDQREAMRSVQQQVDEDNRNEHFRQQDEDDAQMAEFESHMRIDDNSVSDTVQGDVHAGTLLREMRDICCQIRQPTTSSPNTKRAMAELQKGTASIQKEMVQSHTHAHLEIV